MLFEHLHFQCLENVFFLSCFKNFLSLKVLLHMSPFFPTLIPSSFPQAFTTLLSFSMGYAYVFIGLIYPPPTYEYLNSGTYSFRFLLDILSSWLFFFSFLLSKSSCSLFSPALALALLPYVHSFNGNLSIVNYIHCNLENI